MVTVAEFVSHLRKHDRAKHICFCGCPQGLQFFRWKKHDTRLIQLQFDEPVFRNSAGQLCVDDVTEGEEISSPDELKLSVRTVGSMLLQLEESKDFMLFFGPDKHILKFVGVVDIGEWVSIEFEQRIYRGEDGRFVVEETRDGRNIREVFPLFKE